MAKFKAPTSVSFYGYSGYYGGAKIKVQCPSGYTYIYASSSSTGGIGYKTATKISGTRTYTIDVAADTSSTGAKKVYIVCSDTANLSGTQSGSTGSVRKSVSVPRFAFQLYNGNTTAAVVQWSGGAGTTLSLYNFQEPPDNYITLAYTTTSSWLGSLDSYSTSNTWGSIYQNQGPSLNGKTLYGLCQKSVDGGGSIDYYNCSSQKYTYGIDYWKYGKGKDAIEESGTYPNTSTCPKNSSYTFDGWTTSATSTSGTYDTIEDAIADDRSTVYAVYYKNGSSSSAGTATYYRGSSSSTVNITKKTGTSYYYGKGSLSTGSATYSYGSPSTSLSGYSFVGWATDINSYTSHYSTDYTSAWNNSSNSTIYGVYSKSRSLSFYSQIPGDTAKKSTGSFTNYLYGTGNTTNNRPSEPTLKYSGFRLVGWATSTAGTPLTWAQQWDNGATTVYAIWEADTYSVTITYDANGGTGAPSASIGSGNVGSNINIQISSTEPTKNRHIFKGWADGNSTTVSYESGQTYQFSADKTLYAVWENKFGADNVYYGVNGEWKLVETYYGVDGQWVPLKIYYGNDNKWKNNT